ncbi:MAG: Rpn family recombination-promoting nuclease/putative transposase [bacterium]|nr:Rpn family recombination-promoting nuclease/putative transposase [bacterium]
MGLISLKYDFSFKRVMSNEEVRKYFISDVLGIPVEEIRSVKLVNPFLWKRYFWQKQGVLDVRVELNDDKTVDIELQIKMVADWDRRSLFYLAKMYTEELLIGERYHKLKKCICINLLDFNLDEKPEYHRVYRMRDEKGQDYSDLFEMHVIELRKQLKGTAVDDWIRLLNVKTEGELEMISAKNPGIAEAMREMKIMSLRKSLRALHEAHLKEIRDRNARDDFVRMEGREAGKAEGLAEAVWQLLSQKGAVPVELEDFIRGQKDRELLKGWLLTASRVEGVEEFIEETGIGM